MNQHAPATPLVAGATAGGATVGTTAPVQWGPPVIMRSLMHSTANGLYGLSGVPRRRKIARLSLSDAFNRRSIEALVMQAYFQLIRVAWNENGSRSTSLAKYDRYEVRLVEKKLADSADAPNLWVELHARDVQAPIEARGCDDLEAAAVAAGQMMTRAERLQSEVLSKRGTGNSGPADSGESS